MNRELDPASGRAVQVGLSIGLFEALTQTPKDLPTLCADCGCAPRGLRPLLHLLASLDLLKMDQGGLFTAAPGVERYLLDLWPRQWQALYVVPEYEQLEKSVREGRPVRPAIESDGDDGDFFLETTPILFDLHWPDADYLAQSLPATIDRALDLGAGSAVWSLALAKRLPHLKVTAIDRDRVLEQVTTPFLEKHNVRQQFHLWPGSYHDVLLEPRSVDLVFVGHLLHSDGWDLSRRLLRKAHGALTPGGYLVIAEILGGEPRSADYGANVFDLNMLMLTENGLVFTASELEILSREAGFTDPRWVQGPGQYPTLVARKEKS